jgi:hypothetical protein
MEKKTIRLLGEDFQRVRWIDPAERLSMLASGQAEKVYRDPKGNLSVDPKSGNTDGTIKLKSYAPDESADALPRWDSDSPTSLTPADIVNNAAGRVDTPKRSLIYKLREEGQQIAAAIRCYGHDKADKPKSELVGNAVDVSMSRVEQWHGASADNARAVTVACGKVIGITERELQPGISFSL